MIDSRAGRVLTPGGRSMVDAGEWRWITEHATGGFDHLLIGTSLPLIMAPGAALPRGLERGGLRRRLGRARLEASGRRSARAPTSSTGRRSATRSTPCASCCARSAPGGAATRRASIVVLSGDVHHAYLAEVGFPAGSGVSSRVWQATCSPFRNPLGTKERRGVNFAFSRAGKARRPRAGPPRRRAAAAGALALPGRRPAVRQPGRDARARRAPRARAARARHAGRRPRAPKLEVADEHCCSPNGVFAMP